MPEPEPERLPPDEESVAYPTREPPTEEEIQRMFRDLIQRFDEYNAAVTRRMNHLQQQDKERDTP